MEGKFTEKLAEIIKENKLTQKQFADKIGKNYTTVYRYIVGERLPSLSTVNKIREIFGDENEELYYAWYEAKERGKEKYLESFNIETSTFGGLLKYVRLSKRLSFDEFAEVLGTNGKSYANYERGYALPGKKNVMHTIMRELTSYFEKEDVIDIFKKAEAELRPDAGVVGNSIKYGSILLGDIQIKKYNPKEITFFEAIKERRLELGITERALSEMFGCTLQTCIDWQHSRLPNPEKIIYLAEYLKIDIYSLLPLYINAYTFSDMCRNELNLFVNCIMLATGMTRYEFCKYMNVNKQTLRFYLEGRVTHTGTVLKKMSAKTGITVPEFEYMMGKRGEFDSLFPCIDHAIKKMIREDITIRGRIPNSVVKQLTA